VIFAATPPPETVCVVLDAAAPKLSPFSNKPLNTNPANKIANAFMNILR